MKKTRVRFAPSPTGPLHMGGVRTALYNYLYAKQNGGDFIIRIEDTDSHRFVPGAEQYIIEALRWCGIIPDEGVDENGKVVETASERHPHAPYRQSQRRGIYRQYAEQLVKAGQAYYAFDSSEELDARRAEAEAAGKTFIYNYETRRSLRNSLTLPPEEVDRLLRESTDWTVRFKMPENTVVPMDDLIRGHIEVNTSTLDDKVLWKRADELPTYHLANIVDDHLMEITEVIRGEEWLPSLPLHYLLYKAFGWEDTMPRFAHLSLLLKPVGNGKLSKRDGDKMGFPVFPLEWTNPEGEKSHGYREDGYFPEAFVNMLALLGWNPGDDREIFSMEDLIKAFSMDKVQKAGAKFNPDKAKWFNKEYLRLKSDAELAELFLPVLLDKLASGSGVPAGTPKSWGNGVPVGTPELMEYVTNVVGLIKERATFVQDFWDIAWYLFKAPETFNEKDMAKFWKEENYSLMKKAVDNLLESGIEWTREAIETNLVDYIKSNEWPMGKVMNCLRLALSGSASGLGIADILSFIGKEECRSRIDYIFSL
ncbi:MAG: glutamate--tRNA ligase [Bacteroidales bacterium]|nr:glutamate--tRNA ligase [Bacteroidales bacterium]